MSLIKGKTLVISVFNDRGRDKVKVIASDGRGRVFGLIRPL